jgi:hypothetical protein
VKVPSAAALTAFPILVAMMGGGFMGWLVDLSAA